MTRDERLQIINSVRAGRNRYQTHQAKLIKKNDRLK